MAAMSAGCLLIVPTVAGAHRGAVHAETRAMVYHASGRFYGGAAVGEPRSAPLRCFKADIATVMRGSQWGAWRFSNYADQPAHESRCRTANGITIEHKIHGRWYVLWEGSDGYPPTHTTREGSLTLRGVQRSVAKDLERGLN
ncbi:MAG: hypothetical protein ACRDPM_12840 [Solirubrobacteraceae bacterium]